MTGNIQMVSNVSLVINIAMLIIGTLIAFIAWLVKGAVESYQKDQTELKNSNMAQHIEIRSDVEKLFDYDKERSRELSMIGKSIAEVKTKLLEMPDKIIQTEKRIKLAFESKLIGFESKMIGNERDHGDIITRLEKIEKNN